MRIPTSILKYLGPEDRLHMQCAEYLKLQYPRVLWAHPPNEGKRPGYVARFKLKYMGVKSGLPDFIFFEPRNGYHGLALEAKVKPNKTTPNQKEWLRLLEEKGYKTGVFYEFNEFKNLIDKYFVY